MESGEENKSMQKNSFKKGGMFEGAHPLLFQLAKDLRKNMTEAEKILWMHLKKGVCGLKFRRQHPIGSYVADFYCHKIKFVIEIDGSIHNSEEIKMNDIIRENDLKNLGCVILRFTNYEVEKSVETVLSKIEKKVHELLNNLKENKI